MRAFLAALALAAGALSAHAQSGVASVYWEGSRTANGERLCVRCFTAAHRTLPFGTLVRVCRAPRAAALGDGGPERRCIIVRINDRGPFVRGRIIDLTPAGAHALGFSGLARVTIEPLGGYRPRRGDFGFF